MQVKDMIRLTFLTRCGVRTRGNAPGESYPLRSLTLALPNPLQCNELRRAFLIDTSVCVNRVSIRPCRGSRCAPRPRACWCWGHRFSHLINIVMVKFLRWGTPRYLPGKQNRLPLLRGSISSKVDSFHLSLCFGVVRVVVVADHLALLMAQPSHHQLLGHVVVGAH
jgi:hypothetical protein